MKKYQLLFLLFFIAFAGSAQIQKGKFYTGIGLESNLNFTPNFSVLPAVQFGLSKHSTLGVYGLYYKTGNYTTYDYFQGNNKSVGAGLNYTYHHFFKRSTKWGWYLSGNLELQHISIYNTKAQPDVVHSSYRQISLIVRPGIFYQPSKRVTFFFTPLQVGITKDGDGITDLASPRIGVMFRLGR